MRIARPTDIQALVSFGSFQYVRTMMAWTVSADLSPRRKASMYSFSACSWRLGYNEISNDLEAAVRTAASRNDDFCRTYVKEWR
jgi:hypothetical protein